MQAHCIIKACYVGLFALSLPLCSISAQSDDVVYQLDSLIVDGNSLNKTESSAPLQRLSAHDIKRLGVTNVGDAMKHLGGVTVKDYGGIGGLKTVSIRGMGTQHTAVFYDGVAVGDCQNGQVDLGRFSTDNLAGLQLLIGEGDDIYRSARMLASAGSISLETHLPKSKIFKAGVRAASFDSYQANIYLADRVSNRSQASLFIDYTNAGGCYRFDIGGAGGSIGGRRINSDIESLRAEANLRWSKERHSLRAKIYGFCSERGVPGAVIVDNPLSSERLLSRNIFGQMLYEFAASPQVRMKAYFKQNYSYDSNRLPATAGAVTRHHFEQHESDLSYTLKWQPTERITLVLAEELVYNTLSTSNRHNVMSAKPNRLTILSAASLRYSDATLCATASLLHSNTNEWSSKGEVSPRRSRLSPSFSLYFYPFGRNLCLRASYCDIFRLPTFNDLYYRESGNFKLRPEKSRMLNIGAAYSLSQSGILQELTLSTDAYCGRVSDKIVAVPGIFIWKMSNVDEVLLSGIDANVSTKIKLGHSSHLEFSGAYSYMHAVDNTEGSAVKGEQIIYTPRHSGSASTALRTLLLDAGYSLVWSCERYRLAQNIPSSRVDGYCDHSIWLSRDWTIGKLVLSTRIEAMNLLDKNYEIIRYYPMPGRSVRLSATINL